MRRAICKSVLCLCYSPPKRNLSMKSAPLRPPGIHSFDGACLPGHSEPLWDAFSVGVFEWVPTKSGKGVKRGKVKVRVKGLWCNSEAVFAKAREIACELDAGTYSGPKNVSV